MSELTRITHLLAKAHEKYGTPEGRACLESAMQNLDEVTA